MNALNKFSTVVVGTACLMLAQLAGSLSPSIDRSLASLSSSLPINLSAIALADGTQGYVPPGGLSRPQRTDGSGSRGCSQSLPVSLNLLTPKDHIAQTVSAHPTFLWYISGKDMPRMEFALIERGVSQPVLVKQLKAEKPGIMRLELPTDAPELVPGREYRWTVSLICNAKRPSENMYARAWIKRIPVGTELAQKLAAVNTDSDRSSIYASSGVWSDAIATIYKAHLANPQDKVATEYFLSLLDRVGLVNTTRSLIDGDS